MRPERGSVRLVQRAASTAVAMLVVVSALTSLADTRPHKNAGSSSAVLGNRPYYASVGLAFAQMDDDAREEFVAVERTAGYPRETVATISTWSNGTREIKWQGEPSIRVSSMVVGNVDDDPMAELVLFGEWNHAGRDTLKVVQWDGSSYRTTGSDRLSARLGALGDVDADGREEFVFVHVPRPAAEAEGEEPATLVVSRYRDGGFERIRDYDVGHGVMAVAVGDLDGDGRAEIATSEKGNRGVRGQIAIYTVDPDLGIRRLFARNGFLKEHVTYLGIFASGGASYLLVEQGRHLWKSVFRLADSPDNGFELVPVKADRVHVLGDGIRSTMAYSSERGAYVRFLDQETIEFIQE